MSHHIYQTEGVVLSGIDAGDASRFLYIYTKHLGLIGAWGQGLRKIESKLRCNLQDFSHISLNVVRGRHMWRITDAEQLSIMNGVLESRQKLVVLKQIMSLMRKLLDEGEDTVLYALFTDAILFLNTNTFSRDDLIHFELLYVFRMLHHLGYGQKTNTSNNLLFPNWNKEIIDCIGTQKIIITKLINNSLFATQIIKGLLLYNDTLYDIVNL